MGVRAGERGALCTGGRVVAARLERRRIFAASSSATVVIFRVGDSSPKPTVLEVRVPPFSLGVEIPAPLPPGLIDGFFISSATTLFLIFSISCSSKAFAIMRSRDSSPPPRAELHFAAAGAVVAPAMSSTVVR